MTLSNDEISRFSRHLILPHISLSGQTELKHSHIAIVGAGGIGSSIILYLASAGIGILYKYIKGTLSIFDDDIVSLQNLHRQVLYTFQDIGKSKAEVAKIVALSRNPNLTCHAYPIRLNYKNAFELFDYFNAIDPDKHQTNLIIDATDNFNARYLINDLSIYYDIPWIFGSAIGFEGQTSTFNYKCEKEDSLNSNYPCYKCLFPTAPPQSSVRSCDEFGVLGVIPGLIGMIQALEAQKILISSLEPSFAGKLLLFDSLSTDNPFKIVNFRKKPRTDCLSCGSLKMDRSLLTDKRLDPICANNGNFIVPQITVNNVYHTMIQKQSIEDKNSTDNIGKSITQYVIDVRESHELDICKLQTPEHITFLNIPYSNFVKPSGVKHILNVLLNHFSPSELEAAHSPIEVYVICRRGKDSILATYYLQQCIDWLLTKTTVQESIKLNDFADLEIEIKHILKKTVSEHTSINEHNCKQYAIDKRIKVFNVTGGLHAWASEVDKNFPVY